MSEEKKIIIDEDWKSQVEAEKQTSQQPKTEAAPEPGPGGDDDPPMPPASMEMLVSTLATEALMSLGQIPHPISGKTEPRRNQAKYLIDTIALLKEKTAGNIPAEETQGIDTLLHTLRMAFVQMPK